MGFRLIASESANLTTIRVVGRLRDDAVAPLSDACGAAKRPLVLDLTELTGASEAGVLLLTRVREEGAHLLGASPYIRLLLERAATSPSPPARRRTRSRRPGTSPTDAGARPRP